MDAVITRRGGTEEKNIANTACSTRAYQKIGGWLSFNSLSI